MAWWWWLWDVLLMWSFEMHRAAVSLQRAGSVLSFGCIVALWWTFWLSCGWYTVGDWG
jgi:hypothetical protein